MIKNWIILRQNFRILESIIYYLIDVGIDVSRTHILIDINFNNWCYYEMMGINLKFIFKIYI